MTRANSTMGLEDGGCARNHRAAVFVAALVATACCFSLVPGDTLAGSLAQGAALAAVALAAVAASRPRALRAPRLCGGRGLLAWALYVLAVGLAAGLASLVVQPQGAALDASPLHVMLVVALCLLTAVFEEGIFRVLALDAFAPALGGGRRGMLRAALVSAVLFSCFPRRTRLFVAFGKIQRTCNFSLSRSMNSGIMFTRFDKKPLLCGRGGIGRRVRFRSVWGQPHGGSSPLARTI